MSWFTNCLVYYLQSLNLIDVSHPFLYLMITLCCSAARILKFVSSSLQTTDFCHLSRSHSAQYCLFSCVIDSNTPCRLFLMDNIVMNACSDPLQYSWHWHQTNNNDDIISFVITINSTETRFPRHPSAPPLLGKPPFCCRGDESWQWLVVWQDYWRRTGDSQGSDVKGEPGHCVCEDASTESSTSN